MRQNKIISYADLEARVTYLENLLVKWHEFLGDKIETIDRLHQFLSEVDGDKSSDNPEA
mgnify:CR=1 FL=1